MIDTNDDIIDFAEYGHPTNPGIPQRQRPLLDIISSHLLFGRYDIPTPELHKLYGKLNYAFSALHFFLEIDRLDSKLEMAPELLNLIADLCRIDGRIQHAVMSTAKQRLLRAIAEAKRIGNLDLVKDFWLYKAYRHLHSKLVKH